MATLETIRLLTVRGRAEGLAELTRSLADVTREQERVNAAGQAATLTADQQARRMTSVAKSFDGLERSLVGGTRAAQSLERGFTTVSRYLNQAGADAGRAQAVFDALFDKFDTGAAASRDMEARLATLTAKFDPVTASAQRMTAEIASLNEAQRLGINIAGGYTAAYDAIVAKYNETAAAADRLAAAQAKLGLQTGIDRRLGIGASPATEGAGFNMATTASLEQLAREQDAAAASAAALDVRISALIGKFDPAQAAAKQFETDLRDLAEAERLGISLTGGYDAALTALITKYDTAAAAAARFKSEQQALIAGARSDQNASNSQEMWNAYAGMRPAATQWTGSENVATTSALTDFAREEEEAARESERMAASLNELRWKIEPLAAAFDKMEAEIAQYKAMLDAGVISQEQFGAAVDHSRGSFDRSAAQIKAVGRAGQMSTGQLVNMQYQLNDVAVSLASGQSPFVVLMQQGMQVSQIFAPGTTLATAGKSLASGFMSMLTPINLAVVGVAALAGGVALLASQWKSASPTIEDALEKHEKRLKDIASSYGKAGKEATTYVAQARAVSEFMEKMARDQLRDRLNDDLNKVLLTKMQASAQRTPLGDLFSDMGLPEETVSEKYRAFTKEIETLRDQLRAGVPDVLGFREALVKVAEADLATDEIRKAAKAALDMTEAFAQAQRQIEATIAALGRFGNVFDEAEVGAGKAPDYLRDEMARRGAIATAIIGDRKEAEGLLRGAEAGLSNAGLTDYARGLAEISQRYAELRRQAQEAGRLDVVGGFLDRAEAADLAAAAKSVEMAWTRVIEEYGRTTEAMVGEAALWGRSTYEIERYKATLELTTQARQNDGVVTQAEIALISQEADERAAAAQKIAEAEYARQKATEAGNEAAQASRGLVQGLIADFRASASASEMFINALNRLTDSLIDMALNDLFRAPEQTPNGMSAGGLFYQGAGALFGVRQAANANVPGGPAPVSAAMPPAGSQNAVAYSGATASSTDIAANLLRSREGFRALPYDDVNALRAGYGSDTTTDPLTGAISRVTAGTVVSREMAEADLARRIGETQSGIAGKVGQPAWDALNPGTQGALTSIGYNYGSLPDRLVPSVQSGDTDAIARAIEGLAGDNSGINESRRMLEAQMVRESQTLAGFGQNVTAATGSVGQFGSGLSSVAQAITPAGSTQTGGGLFGWLGGLFGGGTAAPVAGAPVMGSLYHSGGVAGNDNAPMRRLSGDEIPAVLRRGEGVFTPGQMAAMGGGSNVNVQVIDQRSRGADVERQETTGPDGEKLVRLIVRDEVKAGFRDKGYIGKNLAARGAQRIPAMR